MSRKNSTLKVTGIPKGCVLDVAKLLHAVVEGAEATTVADGAGNMPDWAQKDEMVLWGNHDQRERSYGPACQLITLTLPEGVGVEQGEALVRTFAKEELGTKPFAYAIRAVDADNASPTQAVLLVSGRVQDGIYRDAEHFFRRYRNSLPAFSGCQKDSQGRVRGSVSDPELTRLQNWKRMCVSAGNMNARQKAQ
jgi:hypothetical protein